MTIIRRFTFGRYMSLVKAGVMESLVFRAGMIVTFFGNIAYLIVIYFLWRAIYASSPTDTVNGMTFYDTMIYLVLASALFNFMERFIVWFMGRDFQSGKIINDMIKPMGYQAYVFFYSAGGYVIAFCTTFLPTFIVVCLLTNGAIALSVNLLYFVASVCMAVLINFCIDFFVGTICLYTQSVWGVNIMKEVVVALLSGAAIPLAFFPDALRVVVNYLPFQAIYNAPLQILINKTFETKDYLNMLVSQLIWVVVMMVISRVFWHYSKRIITVNGG